MTKALFVIFAGLCCIALALALYFFSNVWLHPFHSQFLNNIDVAQGTCIFTLTALAFGFPAWVIWDSELKDDK